MTTTAPLPLLPQGETMTLYLLRVRQTQDHYLAVEAGNEEEAAALADAAVNAQGLAAVASDSDEPTDGAAVVLDELADATQVLRADRIIRAL